MQDGPGEDGREHETGVTEDADGLTRERLTALAETYQETAPFALVEREHIEMLPSAFASGKFGRRDAEWVVQWYHRRGDAADDERRAAETRFLDNDNDAIVETIQTATAAETLGAKMTRLTSLTGVDVGVGAAFLAYMHPEEYAAVGPRTWRGLRTTGAPLDRYPDGLEPGQYRAYLDAVDTIAERTDSGPWVVYRALWQLGSSD